VLIPGENFATWDADVSANGFAAFESGQRLFRWTLLFIPMDYLFELTAKLSRGISFP
jgi:hypothetical protein